MKRILCLILCAAALLCLCACGSDPSAYTPTGNALSHDDPTTPAVTLPITGQPQRQDITMAYYPNKSFNPLTSSDYTNRALIPLIYQGLFTVDRDYEPKPILCKSYTMTEDMRTYVFYLQEATFSDGTLLTAQDVVATLNAALESEVYKGRFHYVKEITTTPDGGVMVKLAVPYENLPILLDVPILKATELERERPVGTGPYRLDATTEGMRLFRRTDWWCRAELNITDDTITLISATDSVFIRDEFEFGDINLVCANPVSNEHADYRCDYELWDCESGVFLYLGCNLESEVFSVSTVRSALTHAIDRSKLAPFYRGFARPTTLPVSPLSPYYSAGLASRYEHDPALFAQAVITAGLAGKEVTLLVNKDDVLRVQAGRSIATMLTECGLTVIVSELDTNAYRRALRYGNFDLYLGQTKLSPNMDLTTFFHNEGAIHYGGLNDVTLNALCQEALANQGNYYNLHQQTADDGRITSIAFLSYAVYADRGLLTNMVPARDNIFYYDLGKSLDDVLRVDTIAP